MAEKKRKPSKEVKKLLDELNKTGETSYDTNQAGEFNREFSRDKRFDETVKLEFNKIGERTFVKKVETT
jgi:hypothetical protein